jgi:hypothetical protein
MILERAMPTKTERQRDGAIRFGEINADQVIRLALKTIAFERAMWRAIHLMEIGKTSEAQKTLQKALANGPA